MVDFKLTDQQRALVAQAHEFARDVLRPAEVELDKIADPQAVFTSDRFRSVMREAFRLGYHKMSFPTHIGGLGLDQVTAGLIQEELLWGAAGLGQSLFVANFVPFTAFLSGKPSLVKEFAEPYCDDAQMHFSALVAVEPHMGSDLLYQCGQTSRFRTTARKVGDDYILNGSKAAFVSNGTLASMLGVTVSMDPDLGIHGTGLFIIPGDLPGISRGRPLDKLGLRCLNQSEVYFEDVKVHKRYLAIRPREGNWSNFVKSFLCFGQVGVGKTALALMRSAYEIAFAYASERIQGGRPIIEHPNIALKLFDAFCTIEAARNLLLQASWFNATRFPSDLTHGVAARCFACNNGPRVISDMIQVLGAYGISKESPIEKFYRDIKLTQIEDGAVDTVGLEAMQILQEQSAVQSFAA
ncbi:MAG: acyl-CoA/acyl-ACP dehydrogenase [Nitrospirae bacterium]|nr:acyl-CoA/acyl-ACP dehydrogenase [Nitrospirota bacterium]